MDPRNADFFIVPIAGNTAVRARARGLRISYVVFGQTGRVSQVRVVTGLSFVAERWPFFNATVAAQQASHVLPTNCDDGGFGKCAPPRAASQPLASRARPRLPLRRRAAAELLPYMVEGAQPVPEGAPWAAAAPRLMRHTILVSCNGLHFGEFRGHHPVGPPYWWTAANGTREPDWRQMGMWGWFIPGAHTPPPRTGDLREFTGLCAGGRRQGHPRAGWRLHEGPLGARPGAVRPRLAR